VDSYELNPMLLSTISYLSQKSTSSTASSLSLDQLTLSGPLDGMEKPAQYLMQPGSPLDPWSP